MDAKMNTLILATEIRCIPLVIYSSPPVQDVRDLLVECDQVFGIFPPLGFVCLQKRRLCPSSQNISELPGFVCGHIN